MTSPAHPFPVDDAVNEPKYVGYHLIAEDSEIRPASLSYVKPSELLTIANNLHEEVTSLRSRLGAVERERDEARKEIEIGNKLLADRDALLREFPCPLHGPCIPHVREMLRKATAATPDEHGRGDR